MDYRALPSGAYTLSNVHIPACLLGQSGDLVLTELSIDAQGALSEPQPIAINMEGALVLPCSRTRGMVHAAL